MDTAVVAQAVSVVVIGCSLVSGACTAVLTHHALAVSVAPPRLQRPSFRRPSADKTRAVAIALAPVVMCRRVALASMTYSARWVA
jgi:hypothetical protein